MQKFILWLLLLAMALLPACYSHTHIVGSGPHSGEQKEYTQWYVFWGLLSIGEQVDGGKLADYGNCRIESKFTFVDVLINIPGTAVSVGRRTVIVEK